MPNAFQKHILNQGKEREEEQVVDAPAFSLTKVLGIGAVIIAPLATYVTDQLAELDLESQHFVALVLGLLGFLAITAAADVLARGIATAASKSVDVAKENAKAAAEQIEAQQRLAKEQAELAEASQAHLVTFKTPLAAQRRVRGVNPDVPIKVLALAHGRKPYFLAQEADEVKWLREEDVTIP